MLKLFRRKDDVERQYPNAPKKYGVEDSVPLSATLAIKPVCEAENLYGSTEMTNSYVMFLKPDDEGDAALNSNALTADFTPPAGILSKLLK